MTHTLKLDFQEGDLPSLHPHALMIYVRGLSIAKLLYEGLTRIDALGHPTLAGASALHMTPDGLTYTFTLRPNYWSDGTFVTAFQYEAAWKEALSPLSTAPRSDLLYLLKNGAAVKRGELPLDALGVQAVDGETLRIELARPSPHFLELLAQPICAPLRHSQQKEPTQFNGPFLVDAWKREDQITLKPNPYFWDRPSIALQAIEICMVQDLTAALALYQSGAIDWVGVPLCPLTGEQILALQHQETLYSHPIERVFWIHLNAKHPLLASPKIRHALSLALDRSAITRHICLGGEPLAKPFPNTFLASSSPLRLEEDRAQARMAFEAGLRELGMTREMLPSLTISYSQQANRKLLAEYLQDVWSQTFGIALAVRSEDWNRLRSNLGQGLFDISGCFEASYYRDPIEILERMTSLNSGNFSQWTSLAFQQIMTRAGQEADPEERMRYLAEAEAILMQEMPFIPIFSDTILFAHTPHLHGYVFDCVGAVDFSRAALY